MGNGGEVTHAHIPLTSGSEVKIQGASTQGRPAHPLIFIPSPAIPESKDKCIWLENLNRLYDPYVSG